MKVVMDTSSLISLELIGALRNILQITNITAPSAVRNELTEIGKYKDLESKAAKKILEMMNRKSKEVIEIKNAKKMEDLLSKDVNRGEAECFRCCIESGSKMLIMDDIDAAYSLESLAIANGIKIKISVAVLVELYKQNKVSRQQLKGYIKKLIKIREWEGGALEALSNRYLKNM